MWQNRRIQLHSDLAQHKTTPQCELITAIILQAVEDGCKPALIRYRCGKKVTMIDNVGRRQARAWFSHDSACLAFYCSLVGFSHEAIVKAAWYRFNLYDAKIKSRRGQYDA